MSYAKFKCPRCGDEQNPARHTISGVITGACSGSISWYQRGLGQALHCDGCGEEINEVVCRCGTSLVSTSALGFPHVTEDKPWAQIDREVAERAAAAEVAEPYEPSRIEAALLKFGTAGALLAMLARGSRWWMLPLSFSS